MTVDKKISDSPRGHDLFGSSIANRLSSFRPLALGNELPPSNKKTQSIIIKDSQIVQKIAEYYHWSVNELINTTLEMYIKSFFDYNTQKENVIEADSFSTLKKHAIANGASEAKLLRRALEIYIRLLQDGVVEGAHTVFEETPEEKFFPAFLGNILQGGVDKALKSDFEKEKSSSGSSTKKMVYIGEKSNVHKRFPLYSFTPLHKFKGTEETGSKKQSIIVKNAQIVQKVAEYYRWSVNELINVALDLYIMTFFDQDIKTSALLEIDCFSTLRKFTIVRGTSEARFIREALDIYIYLFQGEIIERAKTINLVASGKRSIEGVFSEILSKDIAKRQGH